MINCLHDFGVSAAWTPANLAPTAWYYADSAYITQSSNLISTWADKSGSGNNVTQGTDASKPHWNTTLWVNSKPSVIFTLLSSLSTGSGTIISRFSGTSKPFSIFMTVSVFDFDITQRTLTAWQSSGTGKSVCDVNSSRFTQYVRQADSGGTTTVTDVAHALTAKQIHRLAYIFDGISISTYVDGNIAINGQTAAAGVATTLDTFRLGDGPLSPEDSLVGAMVEEVVCNYVVSADDVAKYQTYSVLTFGTGTLSPTINIPTFVSASTLTDTTTTTLNVNYPGSLSADDVIFMHLGSRTNSVLPSTIGGWNTYSADTFIGPKQQNIYWKRAVGTESGTEAVTLLTTPNVACGAMYAFRNVRRSVQDAGISEGSTSSVADSNGIFTGPTLVCSETNRLAVSFYCADGNASAGPITGQSGGTWVNRANQGTFTGGDFSLYMDTAAMSSGGTISGGTANITADNDGVMRSFLFKGAYNI